MRRLPPLDTLRVFEAAARLGSFKLAADELHVTASAVSHRIAALEEELGTQLFVRQSRRIALTREGELLAAGMKRALTEIRRAITGIDRRAAQRLSITAIPSHVTRWLAPRLHRFRRTHPDIELHVSADLALADLSQGTFDVALRFGAGSYPGLSSEPLMGDAILPVASARYLSDHGPVEAPSDILRLNRIIDVTAEDDASGANWRSYFLHHGLPLEALVDGMRFNGAVVTLEAAAGGLGTAIARRTLVEDDLRTGRLVRVLTEELPTSWSHFAVTLPERAGDQAVGAFIDWLKAEAKGQ